MIERLTGSANGGADIDPDSRRCDAGLQRRIAACVQLAGPSAVTAALGCLSVRDFLDRVDGGVRQVEARRPVLADPPGIGRLYAPARVISSTIGAGTTSPL